MDKEVLGELKNIVKTQQFSSVYEEGRYYTLQSLYKRFASLTMKSLSDIANTRHDFLKFVYKNRKKIIKKYKKFGFMSLCYRSPESEFVRNFREVEIGLEDYSNPNRLVFQEQFADTVHSLIGPDKRILEVGSGGIPASSMVLAKDAEKLYSVDKFLLPDEFLKELGIIPIDGLFDSNSSTYDSEYLVGRRPCSAIDCMVERCTLDQKKYFIELCSCKLDEYFRDFPTDWRDILPIIDKDVKFYRNYAFNLDVSKAEIDSAVREARKKHQPEYSDEELLDSMNFFGR